VSLPAARARLELPVADAAALIEVRRHISASARVLGFGLVEQTKLITAASELGRNILTHAGHGRVTIETLQDPGRSGIRLTFADQGPGIPDVDRAMQDGYTSGRGMGMGLPGARRLTHEFSIETAPGRGTSVMIAMWRR
jgi:serine/threonine-protein kinase RsbT